MKREKALMSRKQKIVLFIVVFIVVCLAFFFRLWFATLCNRIKISNREEMFQFVLDNQEELSGIVDEMINLYEANDEKVIILDKNNEKEWKQLELQNVDDFFNGYFVKYISADTLHDGPIRVSILFALTPKGYDYWGIYYTEDGKPDDWGGGTELIKQGDTYVQIGSYYRYETEKILDNWYYYQCDTW